MSGLHASRHVDASDVRSGSQGLPPDAGGREPGDTSTKAARLRPATDRIESFSLERLWQVVYTKGPGRHTAVAEIALPCYRLRGLEWDREIARVTVGRVPALRMANYWPSFGPHALFFLAANPSRPHHRPVAQSRRQDRW